MGIGVTFRVNDKALKKSNLKVADKHNERKYKLRNPEHSNSAINPELTKYNVRLLGSKDIYNDVKEFYFYEFEEAVQRYNEKVSRPCRQIDDYFEKVNSHKNTSLYTEAIVQIGDKDFWENKSIEEKQKMVEVFREQIKIINKNFPNFKMINAIVHLDETSPHLQIIGVCVSDKELALKNNPKKREKTKLNGMDTYVCQSEIFTSLLLKDFQQRFKEQSLVLFNETYNTNEELNEKRLHRTHLNLKEFKELAPIIKKNQKAFDDLKKFNDDIISNNIFDKSLEELELEFNSKNDKKVENNEQINNFNFNLFLLEKFKDKLEKEKEKNEKLKERIKNNNEKLYSIDMIHKERKEKPSFLKKEMNVTLKKEHYDSLINYALESENFLKDKEAKEKELKKQKVLYNDLQYDIDLAIKELKGLQQEKLVLENEKANFKKIIKLSEGKLEYNEKIITEQNKSISKLDQKISDLENLNKFLFENVEFIIRNLEQENQEMSEILSNKFKKEWKEKTLYNDISESENIINNILYEETFFEDDEEDNTNDILDFEKEREEQLYLERMILLAKIEIYEKEIINIMSEEEKIANIEKINELKIKKDRISNDLNEEIEKESAIKYFSSLVKTRNDLIEENKKYSNLRKNIANSTGGKKTRESMGLTTLIVNNNRKIKVINLVLSKVNSKIKTKNNEKLLNIKSLNFKFFNNNFKENNNSQKLKVVNTGRIIIDDDIDDDISTRTRSRPTRSRSR